MWQKCQDIVASTTCAAPPPAQHALAPEAGAIHIGVCVLDPLRALMSGQTQSDTQKRRGLTVEPAPFDDPKHVQGLVDPGLQTVFLHFSIERRTAYLEAFGDLGNMTAIAAEREADHVGFDVFQRPDVTVGANRRNAE